MSKKLICILGPTASGKTRYAVGLAKKLNGEILSADSRQVYRGMDIGTGKDLAEYSGVPYHLIDIVDAGTKYDIFKYQRDFTKSYYDIASRDKQAILCGGSGLYIETATKGYRLLEVPPNPSLRDKLERETDVELEARLSSLKIPHNRSDFDSRKRLIRALEIAIYQNQHPEGYINNNFSPPLFMPEDIEYIGISVSRDERNERIDRRLGVRLKEGMIEEVKSLLDSGIPPEDLIYYGLEYKFVTLFLMGDLTYNDMRERLAIAIHQFAKRQMTWFRGMERRGCKITWVSGIME